MHFRKDAFLLFTVLTLPCIFVVSFCELANAHETSAVGVKPGDWVKYIGSFPGEEYEWINVKFLSIEEPRVNISMSYDLRYPFRIESGYFPNPRLISFDVSSGENSIFLFLIPPNLKVGDEIPVPSDYRHLYINGSEVREYAGVNRTVVWSSYSSAHYMWYGPGTMYWDKETGLLVEIIAKVDSSYYSSLKLIGTSLWSLTLMQWLTLNSASLLVSALGIAFSTSFIVFLVRNYQAGNKVTHPNIGKVLAGIGLVLLILALSQMTVYRQIFFLVGFMLSVVFLVGGVILYSGAWARWSGTRFRLDFGVVLLSVSAILLGAALSCAMYREPGAIVPNTVYSLIPTKVSFSIAYVSFYPYAWLVSPIVSLAISFAAIGVLCRGLGRP